MIRSDSSRLLIAGLVLAACSTAAPGSEIGQPGPASLEVAAGTPAEQVPQPEGWADELALPRPTDLNADPSVIEINLEAKLTEMEFIPGQRTVVWSYDGGVPGPLIRGKV